MNPQTQNKNVYNDNNNKNKNEKNLNNDNEYNILPLKLDTDMCDNNTNNNEKNEIKSIFNDNLLIQFDDFMFELMIKQIAQSKHTKIICVNGQNINPESLSLHILDVLQGTWINKHTK